MEEKTMRIFFTNGTTLDVEGRIAILIQQRIGETPVMQWFHYNDYMNSACLIINLTIVSHIANIEDYVKLKNPFEVAIKDFEGSISNSHKSHLVDFLSEIFDVDIIKQVLADYMVGFCGVKSKEGRIFDTVFWYADRNKKVLNGKYFSYSKMDGKNKAPINWHHSPRNGEKPIGFFGEHLIKPKIWVVESEKTAIVMAIFLYLNEITDTVVWACGGLSNLEGAFSNCTQNLAGKEITLIPDTDPATAVESSFAKWQKKLPLLQHLGANVGICFDLEKNALPYQKEKKFDVADYEIAGFLRTNETVKTLHKKAYQYYLNTETAPLLQEFELPATPATTKLK